MFSDLDLIPRRFGFSPESWQHLKIPAAWAYCVRMQVSHVWHCATFYVRFLFLPYITRSKYLHFFLIPGYLEGEKKGKTMEFLRFPFKYHQKHVIWFICISFQTSTRTHNFNSLSCQLSALQSRTWGKFNVWLIKLKVWLVWNTLTYIVGISHWSNTDKKI